MAQFVFGQDGVRTIMKRFNLWINYEILPKKVILPTVPKKNSIINV